MIADMADLKRHYHLFVIPAKDFSMHFNGINAAVDRYPNCSRRWTVPPPAIHEHPFGALIRSPGCRYFF